MQNSKYRAHFFAKFSCRVECTCRFGFDLTLSVFRSQISVVLSFSVLMQNGITYTTNKIFKFLKEFRKNR